MTRTLTAQFWAKYRGLQDVTFVITPPVNQTADEIARVIVQQAYKQFNGRWVFPDYDQKRMVCVGITDGHRTIHAKDLP